MKCKIHFVYNANVNTHNTSGHHTLLYCQLFPTTFWISVLFSSRWPRCVSTENLHHVLEISMILQRKARKVMTYSTYLKFHVTFLITLSFGCSVSLFLSLMTHGHISRKWLFTTLRSACENRHLAYLAENWVKKCKICEIPQ